MKFSWFETAGDQGGGLKPRGANRVGVGEVGEAGPSEPSLQMWADPRVFGSSYQDQTNYEERRTGRIKKSKQWNLESLSCAV